MNPEKVKVVPFGANIEHNFSYDSIKEMVQKRSTKECNLLFLGVNWHRKGGPLALKVTQKLNEIGIKTNLHVIGIRKIPITPLPDFLIDHGFISKSTVEGREKMIRIMSKCHFLFLPTKAEHYGLVFCEANSLGIPSISTNVGGIPTIIKNDINGRMFDLSATENEYTNYISSVFSNPTKYRELALSSFQEFKGRLNWEVAGNSIYKLLQQL